MRESARLYFDEKIGWSALPGLRSIELDVLANPTAFAEARTGLEIKSFAKPARTRASLVRFNTFLLTHLHTGPIHVAWSRTRVAAQNRYLFVLINHGTVRVQSPNVVGEISGGGVAVVAPGQGHVELEALSEVEGVLFTFDAAEVAPLVLEPDTRLRSTHGSPVFNVAYNFLKTTARSSGEYNQKSVANLRALTRSFAQALIQEVSEVRPGLLGNLLQQALTVIDANYYRPEFSVDSIARELGVSRRSLERAAFAESMGLGDEIRRRRAERAIDVLRTQPRLAIDEIAAQSGFRTGGSLRRALRDLFGSTPSQLRAGNVVTPEGETPTGSDIPPEESEIIKIDQPKPDAPASSSSDRHPITVDIDWTMRDGNGDPKTLGTHKGVTPDIEVTNARTIEDQVK